MRIFGALLALLLVLALVPATHAGAELLLKDGRTVSGVEVRRHGPNYHLTLEGGEILIFPVELVRQLRLAEEGPPTPRPAPTAMRSEGPEVLAGPPEPIGPPATDDQLAVHGPPAKFWPGVFDPVWVPTSDWTLDPAQNDFNPARWFTAPIDPLWTPLSAFDGRIDVFEHSRSAWSRSPIDPVWWPTETTWLTPRAPAPAAEQREAEEESSEPTEAAEVASAGTSAPVLPQFTPAGRPAAKGGRVDPEICAREIFRPLTSRGDREREAKLSVTPAVDASLSKLPLDLYRGRLEVDGHTYAALFATEGEVCRLIGGDLDPLLGTVLADTEKAAHALRSYEGALGGKSAPALDTPAQKIAYAFSLSLLADPGTSRDASAVPTLLEKREDLERLGAQAAGGCSLNAKKRARELEHALADFAPPTVVATNGGDIVTLRTWSPESGSVAAHSVKLLGAGSTSIGRRVVASHVGTHHDEKARK
jgi:hypothetical protein